MQKILHNSLQFIKRFLFFDHVILEWLIRILITLNIILPGFPFADHFYPLDVLIMTALGFWLHISRLKLFSLFFLLSALFINSDHMGWIY